MQITFIRRDIKKKISFCLLSTGKLEEENKILKTEYTSLAKDAETVEEKEQKLLKDITGQLGQLLSKKKIFF